MQNLEKIFGPSVRIFFTTSGGMSLSAVARQQAENKNANDYMAVAGAACNRSSVFAPEIEFVPTSLR